MTKPYPNKSNLYLGNLDVSFISPWPIQGLFNVIVVCSSARSSRVRKTPKMLILLQILCHMYFVCTLLHCCLGILNLSLLVSRASQFIFALNLQMSYKSPASFCLQLEQNRLISYLIMMGQMVLL